MGLAKRYYMEQEERGWGSVNDKNLCRPCLEDGDDFDNFFKDHSTSGKCDYCGKKRKVVEINSLIELIGESIFNFYTDPVNELPYDSREEGGYYGAEMDYVEDILDNHIAFNSSDVRDDIVSAFDDTVQYCEVNPFADKDSQTFKGYWDKFVQIIKYERRFFFPRPKLKRVTDIKRGEIENAGDILNFSVNEMKRQRLFITLKKGQSVYRCREIGPTNNDPLNSKEYIIPSREISSKSASRLSPAGIPIFYASFDKGHLPQEIRAKKMENVYLATFLINEDLNILDLSNFTYPSIFKDSTPYHYEIKKFIRTLIQEIMVPVEHDGSEHLEYVPSQIFSEFLRHRVKRDKKKIDGIIYPSSFDKGLRNIALYIDNSKIGVKKDHKKLLTLVQVSKW